MRGFQCLLLCALLYSASVDAFGTCTNNASCPDNATCMQVTTASGGTAAVFECECDPGFEAIDVPDITIEGRAVTVCVDLGYCSPFDNVESDCGNGQCVIYQDQYGSYVAVCKCKDGFYGEKCDKEITTPKTASSTTKKSGSGALIPLIGGGALLLVLLAGGAAALASSSG